MSSSKRFGGRTLGDIATGTASSEAAPNQPPAPPSPATPAHVPMGELAVRGAATTSPAGERVTILRADPKRCRPWKFHDRHESWYTEDNCKDLLESLPTDGQRQPALARRLHGDPDYDFELIYGMRRRFACAQLGLKLKIEVTDVDDQKAAVLMHVENADRKDITPMERALSISRQLREKLFQTHEEMANAKGISAGMMSQYLKAAALMSEAAIAKLLPDPKNVPVTLAYKVAARLSDPNSKDVILAAAKHLQKTIEAQPRNPSQILKLLYDAPDRSKRTDAVRKIYNVGDSGQMLLHRNPKGKVTLAFPRGWPEGRGEDVLKTIRLALTDLLGPDSFSG